MQFIYDGPLDGPLFVLAHGAGTGAGSDFMTTIATGLGARGIRVARFNFAYMQQRIDQGTRRPPERADKLIAQYQQVIAAHTQPMVIGGKSMGGRMATLLAAQNVADPLQTNKNIKGVACLGYPFHPAGKPENLRISHLADIPQPLFIAQGERDKLGSQAEVAGYYLPAQIHWLWLADGDHDLKPRVKSGYTHQQHLSCTLDALAAFITTCHQGA